jgi:hypothetical protein
MTGVPARSPLRNADRGLCYCLPRKGYRGQSLLLPPGLRDWLDEDHLSRFVIEAIEELGCLPERPAIYAAIGTRPSCLTKAIEL